MTLVAVVADLRKLRGEAVPPRAVLPVAAAACRQLQPRAAVHPRGLPFEADLPEGVPEVADRPRELPADEAQDHLAAAMARDRDRVGAACLLAGVRGEGLPGHVA